MPKKSKPLVAGDTVTLDRGSIHTELFNAAKVQKPNFAPQGEKEPVNAYLMRLLETVAELPTEVYDAMTAPARKWYDDSAIAANASKDVEPPEGFDANPVAEAGGTGQDTGTGSGTEQGDNPDKGDGDKSEQGGEGAGAGDQPDAKATEGATVAAAASAAPPAAATPPAAAAGKTKTPSTHRSKNSDGPRVGRIIREGVIRNKTLTIADATKLLLDAGFKEEVDFKPATVASFLRGSLDTLKVAEELGKFKW